ncbi:MAG: metallophosphoesterase [Bacteroidota bacterium]
MRFIIILTVVFFLVDLYVFRGLRSLNLIGRPYLSNIAFYVYWGLTVIAIAGVIILSFNFERITDADFFPNVYYLTGFVALIYIPRITILIFQAGNDLFYFSGLGLHKLFPGSETLSSIYGWLLNHRWLTLLGAFLAVANFGFVLHGITMGRFGFQVKEVEIVSHKIPDAFNGYRIVQISDLHIGSFYGYEDKLKEAVSMINAQQPDLILYTGDMVNNKAGELAHFIGIMQQLNAGDGIFSVLGNHDYGEYVQWKSKEEEHENLEQLKLLEKECGFRLLMNENIRIMRDSAEITIIGVENIGEPPFPQKGDFQKALAGCKQEDFKILLSHDPSHWKNEVQNLEDIDLTLSGHTHGMQYGINTSWLKWSPVSLKYPQWCGLYECEGGQKLYVNPGLGFIGFPMRAGIRPEITLFVLRSR